MNIWLRILMFIFMMVAVNTRHLEDIFLFERRENKTYYIIFNVVCAITYFYMIFILLKD